MVVLGQMEAVEGVVQEDVIMAGLLGQDIVEELVQAGVVMAG